jgi:hypothetical protein
MEFFVPENDIEPRELRGDVAGHYFGGGVLVIQYYAKPQLRTEAAL